MLPTRGLGLVLDKSSRHVRRLSPPPESREDLNLDFEGLRVIRNRLEYGLSHVERLAQESDSRIDPQQLTPRGDVARIQLNDPLEQDRRPRKMPVVILHQQQP